MLRLVIITILLLTFSLECSDLHAYPIIILPGVDEDGYIPASEIYLLEDRSARLNFETVQMDATAFKSADHFPRPLKRNYDHPWWIKLRILNTTGSEQKRWLDIPGDIVNVNVIKESGEHCEYRTGFLVPYPEKTIPTPEWMWKNYIPLTWQPEETLEVVARIENPTYDRQRANALQLLSPSVAKELLAERKAKIYFRTGLFQAAFVITALISFIFYWMTKTAYALWLMLFAIVGIVFFLVLDGFTYRWMPNYALSRCRLGILLSCLVQIASISFLRHYLNLSIIYPKWDKIFLWTTNWMAVSLFFLLGYFFIIRFDTRLPMTLTTINNIGITLLGLLAYLYFFSSANKVVRLFAIGGLCSTLAIAFGLFYLYLYQRDQTLLFFQIAMVLIFVFALIGFAYRISVNQLANKELERAVLEKQDSLETQQIHIQNLEQSLIEIIADLDHEAERHSLHSKDDLLYNVLRVIQTEIQNQQFSIDLIAEKLNMSHRQFSRKIKEVTGKTATQYVMDVRLVLAKRLLNANKAASLEEVEKAVGLQDPRYLAKKLTSKYGKSIEWHEANSIRRKMNGDATNADREWLKELRVQILKNIKFYDFNAEFLASSMRLSKRQLERKVKKSTGLSVGNYIREERYKIALKLLEEGNVESIKSLAKQIGLKDSANFSRQFHRRFDKLPSERL